jgi:hypothetical protein
MASLSLGAVVVPTNRIFITPEVVDIPCSGTGPLDPWVSSRCDINSMYGWTSFVSRQVRQLWGVKTSAGMYDRIILVLPNGTSCAGTSWGIIGCDPPAFLRDISYCFTMLSSMV